MNKQGIIRLIATFLVVVMMTTLVACIGPQGLPGKDGVDGTSGKDGITPTIEISEDGYWVINGEKTDVKASSDGGVDENPQGLEFYLQDNGTYIVSCGNAKYFSNIVIPATYKGGAVVGIDNAAFQGCTSLTNITIPDSVTWIGDEAFDGCWKLSDVIISDSVTMIGSGAFRDCWQLFSITIPNSITYISSELFRYASLDESITIPDSVTWIGSYAFCCNTFTSIQIPDSVTSIGYEAFSGCSQLTSITIPDSVTFIHDEAFLDCTSLTSINFEGTVEQWNAVKKGNRGSWNTGVPATEVICSDGTVPLT